MDKREGVGGGSSIVSCEAQKCRRGLPGGGGGGLVV